eukprot:TRINITY_DN2545_c0_g1_i1.p1 TRINITY_DN2545_c0_g1~~TRINITY_DN2545_c0_g1_i1.p1  ORF type:complete len:314 (-),score=49.17 TRINITY_DN2545_c0_g1_i1:177-1118(-)
MCIRDRVSTQSTGIKPSTNMPADLSRASPAHSVGSSPSLLNNRLSSSLYQDLVGSDMHLALLRKLAAQELMTEQGEPLGSVLGMVDGLHTAVISWIEASSGLPPSVLSEWLDPESLLRGLPGVLVHNGHARVDPEAAITPVMCYPVSCGACAFMLESCAFAPTTCRSRCCAQGEDCLLGLTRTYATRRQRLRRASTDSAQESARSGDTTSEPCQRAKAPAEWSASVEDRAANIPDSTLRIGMVTPTLWAWDGPEVSELGVANASGAKSEFVAPMGAVVCTPKVGPQVRVAGGMDGRGEEAPPVWTMPKLVCPY